jgi:signal transduction histidine kinase
MKDRLREARDEVGQRALESTAEPLKAKEAAEAIAEAKSTFLANTSHELRTPMNAVLGMTRILLEEPLTSEQKDYIEIIRKGAARP